ncbi:MULTISPECIES: Msa family membrane protein [Anaerococcus]|jgi:hypothetical protein|uniref:Uncharacterized protein n=1 Tax=Anaerococcus nagyae TaxID=1755241 RepID=A0A3E2TFY2_9FIRM|nr:MULTISPECIES: Msa family membrane protein [Anaerococcus]MBP2070105.1 F0F1-type ATP synthase assembly protein I [Anaerococcus nagyae]MDU1828875.1 Msa family membrane protein [Anaerococcus sp.]MDU1864999.1 Msa family membrane protein [Anaerococcus sp.]MDU3211645.1 Msa family membrane protein [Anaerococcus sp.]RGB74895.1 hypothetical protein DXA39_07755 [Anaerococcus nagyae]
MENVTKNTYIKAIILNCLVFLILGIFLDKMSLAFVLIMLVIPLIINAVLIKKEFDATHIVNKYHYLLPLISFLTYIIFGNIVKNNGKWDVFKNAYSKDVGQMSVKIANSPVDVSQLIFSLIMYVAIGYLLTKIMTSTNKNSKNKVRNKNASRSKSFE